MPALSVSDKHLGGRIVNKFIYIVSIVDIFLSKHIFILSLSVEIHGKIETETCCQFYIEYTKRLTLIVNFI